MDATIEDMRKALEAAGWQAAMGHGTIWKSPSGALFVGPAQAYRLMNEHPQLNQKKVRKPVRIVPTSEGIG